MKNKTKHLLNAAIILTVFLASVNFAQNKPVPETKSYYSLSPTLDISNPMLSLTPPAPKEISKEQKQLESRLNAARLSNNTALAQQLQGQLDNLLGHTQVYQQPDPRMHYRSTVGTPEEHTDYALGQIHNLAVWAGAIATVPTGMPTAGTLWYTAAQYASNAADTIKFFKSTNNGLTWSYQGALWLAFNHDFRSDELDVEVVYDGTTVWLFGIGGIADYTDNGRLKCYLFRVPISTGGGAYASILNFPGSSATGNNYYNPRICSDNSVYTSNSYVMMLCSADSTNGSNHYLMQKYVLSISPFGSSPSLDYTQPSGNRFGWSCNCSTGPYYLYGDIGFYQDASSSTNRVYAVYGNSTAGFNNIYLAYVNNYSTFGGTVVITETNVNKFSRIAFNGGSNNKFGMITVVRQYSGNDWDPYCYSTTNGGLNPGDWTGSFIDPSTNRARTCDVIAIRGGNNLFRVCYAQDNPTAPSCYYSSYNGSSWTSTPPVINNIALDTIFAKPRAGYLNGGGDDCLGIWSGNGGVGAYASTLCATTTGIQPTGIPVSFSLSQNYPNPFNPSTEINYGIPRASVVKLTVYNLLGEEVTTLVNEYKQAGTYNIKFDASRIASGVYFYKLEADGYNDVKKMMLLK